MAGAAELMLQKKLRQKLSPQSILSDWFEDLKLKPKSEDCIRFFEFAYNSGQWGYLFGCLPDFFRNKWSVHWGILIEILSQSQLTVPDEIMESILKGARKQNLVDLLVLSHVWDLKNPEVNHFRKRVLEKLKEEAAGKKETLWEKLGFLRTQRMVEEEGKLLRIMQRMYPEDADIQREWNEFQDRWARHLLSSRTERKSAPWRDHTITEPNQEEKLWIAVLLEDFDAYIGKNSTNAYWFSIGLYFMGLYSEALEVLQRAPDTSQKDWLHVELLLKARRFVEALTVSQELEARYAQDPETTFATHYVRAQALKGLGQHAQAVELLKSLIHIRPSYRSAHSLLSAWLEEGA